MITVGEQQIEWKPGITLDRLMAILEDGRLCMVVRLNGKLISRPNFAQTFVPDDAEVEPLPLIAGG